METTNNVTVNVQANRVMRAKLKCTSVQLTEYGEVLTFNAVTKNTAYPADGADEDNTFAKFSPSAEFKITVMNPVLFGKFKLGMKFYADFTEAE